MEYIIKTKSFPDLGGVFLQMKVRDKLMEVSEKSSFGFAILVALNKQRPLGDILNMIWDQYECAPNAVLDVIDQSTIEDIRKLLKK